MEKNPIGFRPEEMEKISYLARKASGESVPSDGFIDIPTIDVYGNREPWELFDGLLEDEENDRYHFFSELKLKKQKQRREGEYSLPESLRPRRVGSGAWKICPGQRRQILDKEKEMVGLMNRYVYRNRNPSQAHQDKRWVLEEYCLMGQKINAYSRFRFCTVRKNTNLAIDVPNRIWPERVFDEMMIEMSRQKYKKKRRRRRHINPDPNEDEDEGVNL